MTIQDCVYCDITKLHCKIIKLLSLQHYKTVCNVTLPNYIDATISNCNVTLPNCIAPLKSNFWSNIIKLCVLLNYQTALQHYQTALRHYQALCHLVNQKRPALLTWYCEGMLTFLTLPPTQAFRVDMLTLTGGSPGPPSSPSSMSSTSWNRALRCGLGGLRWGAVPRLGPGAADIWLEGLGGLASLALVKETRWVTKQTLYFSLKLTMHSFDYNGSLRVGYV